MASTCKFLQFAFHVLAILLLLVFGALATPMTPTALLQAEVFPHQRLALTDQQEIHFAARAPPMAATNIEVTGGVAVMQGGAFVLHGQETVAALFGFGGDFVVPNTGAKAIAVSADVKTWNQFQSATKGQFVSRTDAAKGWDLYKQANGIQTGAVRSQAAKSFFLKQLGASGKAPKWMNQYLAKGKVPPGHHVDHLTPISVGGADSPVNMRLKDIATHVTRHKYYRPWE